MFNSKIVNVFEIAIDKWKVTGNCTKCGSPYFSCCGSDRLVTISSCKCFELNQEGRESESPAVSGKPTYKEMFDWLEDKEFDLMASLDKSWWYVITNDNVRISGGTPAQAIQSAMGSL